MKKTIIEIFLMGILVALTPAGIVCLEASIPFWQSFAYCYLIYVVITLALFLHSAYRYKHSSKQTSDIG